MTKREKQDKALSKIDGLQEQRVELRLKESQARLERLFKQAPALIAMHHGSDHIYTFSNTWHDRAVGNRPLIGKSLKEAMPELKGQGIYERFDQVFQTGAPLITPEFSVLIDPERDGNIKEAFFSQVLQPIYTPDNQVEGVMSFAFEITEQVKARQVIIESEEQFRAIFDQAAVGMCQVTPDGRWIRVNQTFCDILGYTAEELVAHSFADITHPEDLVISRDQTQRLLAAEIEMFSVEKRYIRQDKSVVWANQTVSLIRDTAGNPKYFIDVVQDINDRKQAEAAVLQRNRELAQLSQATRAFNFSLKRDRILKTILESVGDLIPVTTYRVWLLNQAQDQLTGYEIDAHKEVIICEQTLAYGAGIAGWIAESQQALLIPDIRQEVAGFNQIDIEIDQDTRSVLAIPLQAKQRIIGVLQILDNQIDRFTPADLTLFESLAATAAIALENAHLYEQAQHDAETKAMLLQEVNHRVKNNLSAIIGLLYNKRRRFGLQDSTIYQAITEDIISQVQGLAAVHNMLSASEWTPLSLTELTAQIARSVLRTIPKSIQVDLDIPPSIIRVSPEQANNLALIINELTTNSVKYAVNQHETRLVITVRVSQTDDENQLEIRDNGPGYPEEVLQLDTDAFHVGFEVIHNVVRRNLRGRLALSNDQGAVTLIWFKRVM